MKGCRGMASLSAKSDPWSVLSSAMEGNQVKPPLQDVGKPRAPLQAVNKKLGQENRLNPRRSSLVDGGKLPHISLPRDTFHQLMVDAESASGIPRQHLEKDYFLTVTLWALQQLGMGMELKGGTSLAKGFGTLQRSAEDVDLSITKLNHHVLRRHLRYLLSIDRRSSITQKEEWFIRLESALQGNIPGTKVRLGKESDLFFNEQYDNATFWVSYEPCFPDHYSAVEKNSFFPEVLLEVNSSNTALRAGLWRRAAIANQLLLKRDISSYAEEALRDSAEAKKLHWPRARQVECIHPAVTVLQKIMDCLVHRYPRPIIENGEGLRVEEKKNKTLVEFDSRNVRHFSDCAETILAFEQNQIKPPLPDDQSSYHGWPFHSASEILGDVNLLAHTLCDSGCFRVKRMPKVLPSESPSLSYPCDGSSPEDHRKWALYEEQQLHREPFHWGTRLSLRESSRIITSWLRKHGL